MTVVSSETVWVEMVNVDLLVVVVGGSPVVIVTVLLPSTGTNKTGTVVRTLEPVVVVPHALLGPTAVV